MRRARIDNAWASGPIQVNVASHIQRMQMVASLISPHFDDKYPLAVQRAA